MEKILYLHGLDSFLQDDRRQILQTFAYVEAPTLDYLHTPNLFDSLQKTYSDIKAIIGSSAGGLVAYYLAQKLNKPCLLFNPAMSYRATIPFSTSFDTNYLEYMQIVLGIQDEVISSSESLKIIQADISKKQNVAFHIINLMAHSYPIEIFEQECRFFFEQINI